MNGAKILLVDDESENLDRLTSFLSQENYQLFIAKSGEQALEIVSKQEIDLILLDVLLPGIDGFQVTKEMRSQKETRLIPIILVTILHDTQHRIKGIEAGCDDFISKPFDKDELLARINSLLKMSYYRSQLDEKQKFNSIVNQMSDGLLIFDSEFNLISINDKAKDYLLVEAASNPIDLIKHLHQNFKVNRPIDATVFMKKEHLAFDIERIEKEGMKPLILELRSTLIRNSIGEIENIILLIIDVTIKRQEAFRKQMFLYAISHKLTTPLVSISGFITMLKDGNRGNLSPENKEILDKCSQIVWDFKRMVQKLLTFRVLTIENINLYEEIHNVKEHIEKLILKHLLAFEGLTIQFDTSQIEMGLQLKISPSYFDLVLDNLIENAIEYNYSQIIKIKISAHHLGDKVKFSISDNGIGIPAEEIEQIFEKFYQIDPWGTGQKPGFGLGLSTVKHIIDECDGEIYVKSKINEGSTFVFTLPAG